jgi:hypothetical protein
MTKQQVIQQYKQAAAAAIDEARQNGKWDKNTAKARAEVAAAKRFRLYG